MSSSKTAQMPTMENRKLIIDTYVNAFAESLLMLIGDTNVSRAFSVAQAGALIA